MMLLLPTKTDDTQKGFLKKLYLENNKLLYHVAKNILDNHSLAEEAVSEAYERIIKLKKIDKLIGFTTSQDRLNYLTTVVSHVCYNMLKDNKIIPIELEDTIIDDKNNPLDDMLKKESLSEVYEAISELGPNYRTTLTLHYEHGHSVKEIAEMSKTSEGNIKIRLHRARKQLAEAMQKRRGRTYG